MFKELYQSSLDINSSVQRFDCHIHHITPDKALLANENFELNQIINETQKLIAQNLDITNSKKIIFGEDFDELVLNIFRSYPQKTFNILTTDAESYDFQNLGKQFDFKIQQLSTMPFDHFEENFIKKANSEKFDLVLISHVFFNSGLMIKNLENFVSKLPENVYVIIDGRFGFMANPVKLSPLEKKLFYLADASHNAQSGEGLSFLVFPEQFSFFHNKFNFQALAQLNFVLSLFHKKEITVEKIHQYIQKIQADFLIKLNKLDHAAICEKNIIALDFKHHGHFFTFALSSEKAAKNIQMQLMNLNIITTICGSRLQFGFGLYHDDKIDLTSIGQILKF